jgi:hypothetical protein
MMLFSCHEVWQLYIFDCPIFLHNECPDLPLMMVIGASSKRHEANLERMDLLRPRTSCLDIGEILCCRFS